MQTSNPVVFAPAESQADLHRALGTFNAWRLSPALPEAASPSPADERRLHEREIYFVERERGRVAARAFTAPQNPSEFVAWFEDLEWTGPGQSDALFDWLALDATLPQMTWFLSQEIAGEAGFDDLVALTQIKMPQQVKLELARNYWDEMGQGHETGMHGPMLARLGKELGIGRPSSGETVTEALALGNLLVALAINRRYAFQSIGALGVVELTAPGRAAKVNAGLRRLGVEGEARKYFALHATLDRKHSEAWNREVLFPLVAETPKVAQAIAEGALMRLEAGRRCFERYRRELWT
jgi:hypothetical protein